MPASTVGKVLHRLRLGRLRALEPKPLAVRYERERPGELIHIDSKKLGRIEGIGHRITGRRPGTVNRHHGIGWEALHVCVDDASRLAYSEILPDEKKESAICFLGRALAWFSGHGVTVERVMTDNGSAYCSKACPERCRCVTVVRIIGQSGGERSIQSSSTYCSPPIATASAATANPMPSPSQNAH